MFNPRTELHLPDNECTCHLVPHPSNKDIPVDDLNQTVAGYGGRLRATDERIRLAQEWSRDLWEKGFRGRCLWTNVLNMFEPPQWDTNAHYIWNEIRQDIP